MKAVVINYGVGNIYSIYNALKKVGFEVSIELEPKRHADIIVFPGVGTFKAVSTYMTRYVDVINELKKSGVAFLGICIGMQVMFEYGLEGGEKNKGLGWFKGYIDKIKTNSKLPRIGWDKIRYVNNEKCRPFLDFDGKYMYFMHSYTAYIDEYNNICFISEYGSAIIPSMILKDRVIGVQFHPEKSSKNGIEFLKRIAKWLKT
ncbi:imidazole glycerol phosphate synthase subunit HisH [Ignisphaera sp. 4213-co]|uniref:Imidazole glycerol phosphate synthase subunit HisH n=1 Tax=Ignisphaera cupida TaxID=3050454 RepID=A0ABD4Z4Y0_9CREN|nr:imidazole glycerol phosphate synthase subunit HisH [Ignisphaera sp. 4213-co]MDK6028372.1 imidazole glycerol phosphate synthase subunit HisH [Ignisphaera sp. 4213-co]